MSSLAIAESRRASELADLKHRHELAVRDVNAGMANANGLGQDYIRIAQEQRRMRLQAAEELGSTIQRLSALSGEALIDHYCPEDRAKPPVDADGNPLTVLDTLLRGPRASARGVVTHIGGIPL